MVDGESFIWTRSSRLQFKAETFVSVDYKATVAVDKGSTGGTQVQALLRRRTVRVLIGAVAT